MVISSHRSGSCQNILDPTYCSPIVLNMPLDGTELDSKWNLTHICLGCPFFPWRHDLPGSIHFFQQGLGQGRRE